MQPFSNPSSNARAFSVMGTVIGSAVGGTTVFAPPDSAAGVAASATETGAVVKVPGFAMRLIGWRAYKNQAYAAGGSITFKIRKNGAIDLATVTISDTDADGLYSAGALNIAIAAGDLLTVALVNGATSPGAIYHFWAAELVPA